MPIDLDDLDISALLLAFNYGPKPPAPAAPKPVLFALGPVTFPALSACWVVGHGRVGWQRNEQPPSIAGRVV